MPTCVPKRSAELSDVQCRKLGGVAAKCSSSHSSKGGLRLKQSATTSGLYLRWVWASVCGGQVWGAVWGGCVGECGALPQSNICISKVIHTALPIKKDCLIVLINGSAGACGLWACGQVWPRGRGNAGGGVCFAVAAWHSVERSLITQGFSEWVVRPLPVAIVSMFASLRLVATECAVRWVRWVRRW